MSPNCGQKDSADRKNRQLADTDKPLNIVLFLVDDLGWKDVGYYGGFFYETPNIDQLAQEGVCFKLGSKNTFETIQKLE